jgi:hypothetical protein
VLAGAVVATALTAQLPGSLASLSDVDWQGWNLLWPLAVASAWVGVIAWLAQRWRLAALGFAVALVGPWGFLWPGAVASLALAAVALIHAAHKLMPSSNQRNSRPAH